MLRWSVSVRKRSGGRVTAPSTVTFGSHSSSDLGSSSRPTTHSLIFHFYDASASSNAVHLRCACIPGPSSRGSTPTCQPCSAINRTQLQGPSSIFRLFHTAAKEEVGCLLLGCRVSLTPRVGRLNSQRLESNALVTGQELGGSAGDKKRNIEMFTMKASLDHAVNRRVKLTHHQAQSAKYACNSFN